MSAIYQSKYTDKLVSAAQILTERLLENIARKDKTTLPYKFWELENYKKAFVRHIVGANRLLKKFKASSILLALKDKGASYIFYFENPKLIPIIKKYEGSISVLPEELKEIEPIDVMQKPRQQVRNGILETLDG